MITSLYANNFRCLVAFKADFGSFGVLCGPNGAGKSSVFDALQMVRDLAVGDSLLGAEGERNIAHLELTGWHDSKVQEFELGVTAEEHAFVYRLQLEQTSEGVKPRIISESATCDDRVLFVRDLEGVHFPGAAGSPRGFPLDWRQAALASIQAAGSRREIEILQEAIRNVVVLRPNPQSFETQSKAEARHPDKQMLNLVSWYRFLAQEQDWTDLLRDLLREVWPDFRSFKLESFGLNVKVLEMRFEGQSLYLSQLSDGERMLVGLYMIRAALQTGAVQTILVDEADNFVGLQELQPWLLSLRELLDEQHQALLISHNPEILSTVGEDTGVYLWRDNHRSPTRIGPLKVPERMPVGEALARGWARG